MPPAALTRQARRPDPAELLGRQLEALVGTMTELVAITRGLSLNAVLFSGTARIGPDGYWTHEHAIPMAGVAVGALEATGTVTAVAGPPGSDAPLEAGEGVLVVPVGWHLVAPLVGPTLTVWGEAGDRIHVVITSRPLQPSAGAGGATGGGP